MLNLHTPLMSSDTFSLLRFFTHFIAFQRTGWVLYGQTEKVADWLLNMDYDLLMDGLLTGTQVRLFSTFHKPALMMKQRCLHLQNVKDSAQAF